MSAPGRRATYEDLFALPETVTGQIIDGELIALPRPASDHSVAVSVLGSELIGPFQLGKGGPAGWWILDEPELHISRGRNEKDVLVPDLAGWRRERLPVIERRPWFDLAPDWICEVISPSTAAIDRIRKLPLYASFGVEHAWIVDPAAQSLEVFRRTGESWLLAQTALGSEVVRAEPFEAIALELALLWGRVPPLPTAGT